MKKVISMAAVAVLCSTSALFAETSGVFLGAEIGYGAGKFENKITTNGANQNANYDGGGIKYGVVVGYKQFFTQYLGLRYYANLGITHAKLESNSVATGYGWKDRVYGTLVNYGANVDFLVNFVSNESLDFGAFLGLGIGGNTWTGRDLDDHEDYLNGIAQQLGTSASLTRTGFDLSLNVGLRTNIATNHGIELVAKVPFLQTKLFDKTIANAGVNLNIKNTLHQAFSVTARYTFSF